MENFKTLYQFELKKIVNRRIVWITLAIMLTLSVLMSAGEVLFNVSTEDRDTKSGYAWLMEKNQAARVLSGRKIDDKLLKEMRDTVGRKDTSISKNYEMLYKYIWDITGSSEAALETDEETLYQIRQEDIEKQWNDHYLTDGERAYWQRKEKEIEKPLTYEYALGYTTTIDQIYTLNFMLVFLTAICLSGVFSNEHVRKTDQLIFACKMGKNKLYQAKLLAGVTFGMGSVVMLLATAIGMNFLCYGLDGAGASLQLFLPRCSWPLTMGESVLILMVLLVIMTLLYSITAMFLSECLRNSVAVMAIMTGTMILSMFFSVPERYRIASQLYSFFPIQFISFMEDRLVPFLDGYLTSIQAAPILYLLLSSGMAVIGDRVYQRWQVKAR